MTASLYARMMTAAATTSTNTAREVVDAVSGIVTADLAAQEDRLMVAETAVKRAREIHRPTHHDTTGGPWCHECTHLPTFLQHGPPGVPWPCPTIRALNNINPPTRKPRAPRRPPTPKPTTLHEVLHTGLTWLHQTPQPRTAIIDHQGLALRTTTNRTLHFVAAGTTRKALIVLNVTRCSWRDNGIELTPDDQLGPTELTDLKSLLTQLGATVTATWNGHPTTTGTLALTRPPHPTLTNAARRYQKGCPSHPDKGVRCTCDWYTLGRAQITQPTP